MSKKKINIKRVDGVVQGYHVGKGADGIQSLADVPAGNATVVEEAPKSSSFEKFENAVKIAEPGLQQNGNRRKPVDVPEVQRYKAVIEDAVSKGWSVFEGPWGHSATDRSVCVEKYMPDMGGKFLVQLVDRDWKNLEGSPAYIKYGPVMPDYHTNVWFVEDTKPGYAFNEHGLRTEDFLDTDSETLDEEKLIAKASTCDDCGRAVGIKNLNRVGFASMGCNDCIEGMRARIEKPGWYN